MEKSNVLQRVGQYLFKASKKDFEQYCTEQVKKRGHFKVISPVHLNGADIV